MLGEFFDRNIDAALFEIARNILPEIRQLQGGAREIRETLPLVVAVIAQMKDQPPHGIRRIDAVVENPVPCGIALSLLVLTKSAQQIQVEAKGSLLGTNRFAQCDQHRMTWLLAMTPTVTKILFPRAQQFEGPSAVRNFVSKIVGPAAIRVDIVEMLMQLAGKKPRDDAEILVVVRGKPARIALRFVRTAALRRQVARNFEFGSG